MNAMYGESTVIHRPTAAVGEVSRHDQTRIVEVFMAGDIEHAKQLIRRYCAESPCCVTVTPTTYIYRGGEEAGFVVGVRNYPRFPADSYTLRERASEIGELLRDAMGQDSYMVADHSGQTTWRTVRQGG